PGDHETRIIIEIEDVGADAGTRRLARRHRLVPAVDIFLGTFAGNAERILLAAEIDAEDEIGEPAEPADLSVRLIEAPQHRDILERLARDGGVIGHRNRLTHHHLYSSIFGS